ncbi:MAG: type II secretion system F family protein [Planctomycetes bacterium]|nr:type II secretion system F family protein [Planctomycetota bacterium]
MSKSPYQTKQTSRWQASAGGRPAGGHDARAGQAERNRPGQQRPGSSPMYRWSQADAAAGQAGQARPASNIKLKRDEIIFFTTQLAVMIDTGVTLSEALDAIADQAEEPNLKAVVADLTDQVKGGIEFSTALEHYPRTFGRLLVALVRASEASGTMGMMLKRAADYLGQERETVRRIKGAMIYPACMLVFCTLVVTGLLIFILPRFEKIYAGKGAVLPAPTRALLAMSHGLVNYWYIVLTLVVGGGVGLVLFLRSPAGRDFLDTVRIRVPVIGKMYRKAYLARSLRTMATMVSTGVSLLDGLEVTAQVAGNRHYRRIWRTVADQAREGSGLAEELAKHPLIPGTVARMVAAGEKTGQLALVMNRVAEFCEDEVKVAVKSITSLIEPAMIIIMGIIIGGIALALLLPVFSMSKLVH